MATRGSIALVRCNVRENLYHERFLAGYVSPNTWWVYTPDLDSYLESFDDRVNIREVKYRPSYGELPDGMPHGAQIYAFDPVVDQVLGQQWLVEGAAAAAAERRRRRLPPLAENALPGVAAEMQLMLVAAPPPGAGAAVAAPAGAAAVPLPLVVGAAPVPIAGAVTLPLALGAAGGAGGGAAAGVVAGRAPGLEALAAAIRGGPGGAAAPVARGGGGDARTLPVKFDSDGSQYREFREAVGLCEQMEIERFVVQGPRTALWVMRFICENGGTPLGRHTKFKSDAGLTSADPGVVTHEHLCKLLQTALTVDQLDGSNSATIELICRELQLVEEKYGDRLRSKDNFSEEGEYFMRTSVGQSNVCMCPALRTWISEEVRSDAAILKERRKAREERELARAPPGGNSSKTDGKKK